MYQSFWNRPDLCLAVCVSCSLFLHNSHLPPPAASGRLGQGPCRKLHQRGEGSSAEAGSEPWAAAATGARRAALARRRAANGASPCPPAGGGSSVLYHSRFALSCGQVFCLFSIVPFTCFPSLQKSLALFKIDWEQLPRLYPERERENRADAKFL